MRATIKGKYILKGSIFFSLRIVNMRIENNSKGHQTE